MSESLINKIRRLREFGLMDAEDSEIAIFSTKTVVNHLIFNGFYFLYIDIFPTILLYKNH
jgi:hypothetical protein